MDAQTIQIIQYRCITFCKWGSPEYLLISPPPPNCVYLFTVYNHGLAY